MEPVNRICLIIKGNMYTGIYDPVSEKNHLFKQKHQDISLPQK